MKKISVIVPVYNVEKYLSRCLDSLLNQDYKDYEIICVNDCSQDNSLSILKKYEKENSKIKVITNEINMGLGMTRENGMKIATGDYIMFVDSDDYVKQDYISMYANEIINDDYDIIVAGYIRDVDGKLKNNFVSNSIWSTLTYTISCAKMFRKSFLIDNNIHFSKIRCGEDVYFSLSLFYNKPKYKVINYCGYYYYFNRNSITGNVRKNKNLEKFISEIFTEFMNDYDISALDIKDQEIIEYAYVTNMINALIAYGHGIGLKKMRQEYRFFKNDLQNKFPNYKLNSNYGIFKPKGQTKKIRYSVGIVMMLEKLNLSKFLFYLISLF